FDEVAEQRAERKLVDSRSIDVVIEGKNHGTGAVRRTETSVPFRAMQDDGGDVGESLDIVYGCRLSTKADGDRERRLLARPRFLAFDHFQYRRILTGDVVVWRRYEFDIEVKTIAENTFSPVASGLCFRQSIGGALYGGFIIGVYIQVGFVCADGIGGDNDALDDEMGKIFHEQPIFFAAWFILSAVEHHVPWLFRTFAREGPL